MNLVNSADLKAKKNCFLVFRNKKINNFDTVNELIASFSQAGYYFDKIAYVVYDKSEEIVRAVKDSKDNYENLVVYCPAEMEKTLKGFLSSLYSSEFDEKGILKAGTANAFILFSNRENSLRVEEITGILDGKYGIKYGKAFVKTVGAPAQLIKKAIHNAINADAGKAEIVLKSVDFNVDDSYGDCTIEVVYSEEIAKSTFDKVFRTLVGSLEEYVYAVEDFTLAERLFQLLKLRRMKISVAESFTGGGISKRLVEISGVSEVYTEGLNTYANESKINRLGVKDLTLHRYGAVSEQTAREMAEGLLKSGLCDVSIATTGIAGPKSDNTSKPVGLVYIAVGTKEDVYVYKFNLKGDRQTVTNTAINLALFLALKLLK